MRALLLLLLARVEECPLSGPYRHALLATLEESRQPFSIFSHTSSDPFPA